MGAAVAAMLEGMPEPRDLRLHQAGGRCVITVGATVLFDYDAADTAMRNMAISALRQLGFTGRRVAGVLGLTESYVATLHNLALREGSAALIRHARPGPLGRRDRPAAGSCTYHGRPPPRPAAGGAGGGSTRGRACRFPAAAGTARSPARTRAGGRAGRAGRPPDRRGRVR